MNDDRPVPPPAPYPVDRRASRPVWPWILLALFVGVISVFAMILAGLSDLVPSTEGQRVVLDDVADEQGVFIEIPVEGVIVDAKAGGPNPVKWVRSCLRDAAREPNLKGILLRVNSPGGGIRASDQILAYLRSFKDEHQVPVVVYMTDVAASGGYYVSMASDWIVAHDDTITGSIGVIWSIMNWRELMEEKLGVRWDNVKSAEMKDIGSANRDMTIEERALIQSYVDDAYGKFVRLVVAGRKDKGRIPVTVESVRALRSTILTGRRAMERGFVDELGFREQAVAKLREFAGIER
ncbi:MAG: signal peptide peptidase SppA, partial [Planctomycetota bacterium]